MMTKNTFDDFTIDYFTIMTFAGPPGTGKTVLLMLKAGQWLTEGHDVHVVSTYREAVVAAHYLHEALKHKYSNMQVGAEVFVIMSIALLCLTFEDSEL